MTLDRRVLSFAFVAAVIFALMMSACVPALSDSQAASLVLGEKDFVTVSSTLGANGFSLPAGIAFDSAGNLWAADIDNDRVVMFTSPFSTGENATIEVGEPSFGYYSLGSGAYGMFDPEWVAFDPSGNLWVADCDNARVLMFSKPFSTGMGASLVIGAPGFDSSPNDGGANGLAPAGMAFDSDGNLWVADAGGARVLEFQRPFSDGMSASLVIGQPNFMADAMGTGASELSHPEGVAFDSHGDLWVADSANERVLMFSPPFSTGMKASLVIGQTDMASSGSGLASNSFNLPWAITFDSKGDLWVADWDNSRVLEFLPPFSTGMSASRVIGQPDFTTGNPALTATGMAYPSGLAFDSQGNLWVSDQGNSRVLEYLSPPAITSTATTTRTSPISVTMTTSTAPAATTSSTALGVNGLPILPSWVTIYWEGWALVVASIVILVMSFWLVRPPRDLA